VNCQKTRIFFSLHPAIPRAFAEILQFSIVMAAVGCAWIHFVRLHLPSSCTALGEITEKKKGEEGV
jgi:hypothetical protein